MAYIKILVIVLLELDEGSLGNFVFVWTLDAIVKVFKDDAYSWMDVYVDT